MYTYVSGSKDWCRSKWLTTMSQSDNVHSGLLRRSKFKVNSKGSQIETFVIVNLLQWISAQKIFYIQSQTISASADKAPEQYLALSAHTLCSWHVIWRLSKSTQMIQHLQNVWPHPIYSKRSAWLLLTITKSQLFAVVKLLTCSDVAGHHD